MMKDETFITLNNLEIGKTAVINAVGGEGALRQHFLDMGVIPGTEVTVVKLAPMGDPMELQIHGYELTIRLDDAKKIQITPMEKGMIDKSKKTSNKKIEHPGLGEAGKYHQPGDGNPLPDGKEIVRFLISSNLREFAELQKEVVIVGMDSRIEIWSKEKWQKCDDEISADEIAEKMEMLGI